MEAFQGQWLEDARGGGCTVALVPFDHGSRQFDPAGLSAALDAEHLWRPDLLFINSPAGTANRSGVFEQVIGLTKPRFVMLHDAFRDAEIIYAALDTGRYQLLSHFPSLRGMALLGPVGRNPTKRRLRGEVGEHRRAPPQLLCGAASRASSGPGFTQFFPPEDRSQKHRPFDLAS